VLTLAFCLNGLVDVFLSDFSTLMACFPCSLFLVVSKQWISEETCFNNSDFAVSKADCIMEDVVESLEVVISSLVA
jgi:hypothetical protein